MRSVTATAIVKHLQSLEKSELLQLKDAIHHRHCKIYKATHYTTIIQIFLYNTPPPLLSSLSSSSTIISSLSSIHSLFVDNQGRRKTSPFNSIFVLRKKKKQETIQNFQTLSQKTQQPLQGTSGRYRREGSMLEY
ncbi:unnamed protein product [Cuscuta campestris]|uniref:Uncharacterized protein n=1 Tax=Cuscuta campestris TaxID=132261 RepID=A0A484M4A2_9ASTE|nr:unnamed protein product [Cuscuta campestris]